MPKKPSTDQADQELLHEILDVLKGGSTEERQKTVDEKVPRLRDKPAARDEFINLLSYAKPDKEGKATWDNFNSEARGWVTTALAKLCGKGDKLAQVAVVRSLEAEQDIYARYWMLLALHRMGNQGNIGNVVQDIADQYIKQIESGKDPVPDNSHAGPLALAILASWKDHKAAEKLAQMLKSKDFEEIWAVCRALEVVSCREMLEPLRYVVEDPGTWPDIRNKAVKSLGLIESPAAVKALGRVLTNTRDAIVKESVIEGLEHLGQSRSVRSLLDRLDAPGEAPYSVADSLMAALMDSNAQIRRRAAEALPKVMVDLKAYDEGDDPAYQKALIQARIPAASKVVSELVLESVDLEKGVPLLVDALRVIDPPEAEAAATVLTGYLLSEDVSVKQRAEHALKLVGGEKAVQTLMAQKSEVLRAYNDLLAKADEPIQDLFKETMRQAQRSFAISQWMSITIFVIGVGVLLAGLYVAFSAGQDGIRRIFGVGTSIIAVIAVVLDMLLRDPHKRVQEATSVLLRIKVIFLGYVRQIHQVDATFKHEFIEGGKDFGIRETKETIQQINEVMKNTMDFITLHLPVRKDEKLVVDEVLKPWQERLADLQKVVEEKVEATTEAEKPKP